MHKSIHKYCHIVAILIVAAIFTLPVHAGRIGEWKSYTSKRVVRDCVVVDSVVWAATSGGIFSYNLRDNSYTQMTTADGLRTIDLTAITSDNSGRIWIGASNGFLHGYNPGRGTWEYVTALYSLADAPQKRINALKTIGDSLFILSEVGVSVFSLSQLEFGDTYKRFGVTPQLSGKATSIEVYQGKLWVGTSTGVASTSVSNTNPSEPSQWQASTRVINDLAVFHDTLFAAASSGLYFLNGTTWQPAANSGQNILDLSLNFSDTGGEGLFFATTTAVWRYTNNSAVQIASNIPSYITSIAMLNIAGSELHGIIRYDGTNWISFLPPGPITSTFAGIAVDERGTFWSGTGATSNTGFMKYDGSTWKVYDINSAPILGYAGSAYGIDVTAGNQKWISYFGYGIALVNDQDEVIKVFNNTNGLPYTANSGNNTGFVVATGVVVDANGEVWMNIRSANDKNLLSIYNPSTNHFRYKGYPSQTMPILTDMIQDHYGVKWFTSVSDLPIHVTSPGLVFYDPAKRLSRRMNDTTGWGIITSNDGLTDNEITAVAVDKDGSVWVGTPGNGISIILDPQVPYRILQYHPLANENIHSIVVDPLNQKWVATEKGVFVLSADGTTVLEHYDVESTNGKLPSNTVTELALDQTSGTMYFATDVGLAALKTSSVQPVQSFRELTIFPNPFILPSTTPLTVDGLVENSSLKILTLGGDLIRDLTTPGGRVGFWDGRTEQGEYAGSGVYVVVAYSNDGKSVAKGKVAVVRK